MQAGREIFAEQRYEDVAVSDIAERAGVAHGLLFHYFGTKVGFYVAVLEAHAAEAYAEFIANTTPDPARWLRKEIDIFLTQVSKEPVSFMTLLHGGLSAESEVQQVLRRQRDAAADRVIAKLGVGEPSPLTKITVRGWVSSANEMVFQWMDEGRQIPKTRLRAVITQSLTGVLHALGANDTTAGFDPDRFAPSAPR
jgi:AcrR family transcriptional regulator